MKLSANTMKHSIEALLKAHGLLERFESADIETGFHVQIENEPWMPLVIERYGCQLTISHYFEQSGDLIPDPDQEFEILPDGTWFPVAIQFATGHYQRASEIRDQKRFVNPQHLREQIRFANIWGHNIRAQGYSKGRIAERGHSAKVDDDKDTTKTPHRAGILF